jgi:hypothetical protein
MIRALPSGYLLHKNPSCIQTEELSFGKALVFYPKAESTRCTAAVLLEVNPGVRGSVVLQTCGIWNPPAR